MALKGTFRRGSYLSQLLTSCTALLLIPFIIFAYAFTARFSRELERTSYAYYAEQTQAIAAEFASGLDEIKYQASMISFESRKKDTPLELSKILASPYYYLECVDYVAELRSRNSMLVGVYYPSVDFFFAGLAKYSLESYCADKRLEYEPFALAVANNSLYRDMAGDSYYMVSTRLGRKNADAVIVFRLDQQFINLASLVGNSAARFAVSAGATGGAIYAVNCEAGFVPEPGTKYMDTAEGLYSAFEYAAGEKYAFYLYMPVNAVEAELIEFYGAMRALMFVAIGAFAALAGIMVYVSYRPVGRLESKLKSSGGAGGLTGISRALDEMSETNLMIMELLIGNMLYGAPIPEAGAKRLGLTLSKGPCTVLRLSGVSLDSKLRAEAIALIKSRFNVTAYITDILTEGESVVICLCGEREAGEVANFLLETLALESAKRGEVRVGRESVGENAIRESYLSTKKSAPGREAADGQPDESSGRFKALAREAREYVAEHICDHELTQVAVADHFGISVYSLSRLFKNNVGVGFQAFITGQRIERAKELLVNTDKSVSEIAALVGIDNPNYFSRLFKLNAGVSPLAFRKGPRE